MKVEYFPILCLVLLCVWKDFGNPQCLRIVTSEIHCKDGRKFESGAKVGLCLLPYVFYYFFSRMESAPKLAPPSSSSRPLTPVDSLNSHGKNKLPSPQHRSNKKKTSPRPNHFASSLGCIPRHSPLHASPSYPSSSRSPPRCLQSQHKSPPSLPASLPVIGLDDSDLGFGSSYMPSQQQQQSLIPPRVSPDYIHTADDEVVPPADEIGILSETSSSDSSDSSGSESEPDTQPSNSTVTANGRYFCDKILLYYSIAHVTASVV